MTELRGRMLADMKLHGLAPGTQKVYLKSVEHLARHFHRSPDRLSEQELRDYFTYLVEQKRVPSSTLRIEIFGVKFLFDKTLQRFARRTCGHRRHFHSDRWPAARFFSTACAMTSCREIIGWC